MALTTLPLCALCPVVSIYRILIANVLRDRRVRTRVPNSHRVPMVHLDTSARANRFML
jgi:hypothetical protein